MHVMQGKRKPGNNAVGKLIIDAPGQLYNLMKEPIASTAVIMGTSERVSPL